MNLQPVRVERRRNEIFVSIVELADECRPCWIETEDGVTMILMDPRSRRLEIIEWCVDNLSAAEGNTLRAAYGQPPRGQQMSDEFVDGPCMLFIPEALRVPGEPPFQGGRELRRRQALDQLHRERAAYRAEINERELKQGA